MKIHSYHCIVATMREGFCSVFPPKISLSENREFDAQIIYKELLIILKQTIIRKDTLLALYNLSTSF